MGDLPDLPPDAKLLARHELDGKNAPKVVLDALTGRLEKANLEGAQVIRVPGSVRVEAKLPWFTAELKVDASQRGLQLSLREPPRDPREFGRFIGGTALAIACSIGIVAVQMRNGTLLRAKGEVGVMFIAGAAGFFVGRFVGAALASPLVAVKALVEGPPAKSREKSKRLAAHVAAIVEETVESL